MRIEACNNIAQAWIVRPSYYIEAAADTRHKMDRHQEHFIGIDVGTGSARACIIDFSGEIKGLAAQEIKLWQPVSGYEASHYVSENTWLS